MRRLLAWPVAVGLLLAAPTANAQLFQELSGNPLGSSGDWTNYLRLDDIDGDGDLDVLVPSCGGFFASPAAQPFRLFVNDGAAGFSDGTAAAFGSALNLATRVVAVGDIDGDGDLDIYLPSAAGAADRLYVNDGLGVFTDEGATRLGGLASRSAAARFGDIDADGDLDLLVGGGYASGDSPPVRLLLNDGDGNFTDATPQLPSSVEGTDPDDIDLIDVDRDFDLDLLINTHEGKAALWRNDGSGTFTDASGGIPAPVGGPFYYGPAVCDVDGDGDLDIWSDNSGPGPRGEQLSVNDGLGGFTDVTGTQVSGNPSGADDNGVNCVDVDGDGDLDAVVPSLSSASERLLLNTSGSFALQGGAFPNTNDPTLWMDFGDLDGDGRIDAVSGQGEGSPARNRVFLATNQVPVDTRAPVLLAEETLPTAVPPGSGFALRFAVQDEVVSDSGPRCVAYAELSVNGGPPTQVRGAFMGGDLFRVAIGGQMGGSTLTVTPCARDREGNVGCGTPQTVMVSVNAVAATSTGAGGATGTASAGATAVGVGGAGATGTGAGGDGFIVEDPGCSCRTAGRRGGGGGFAAGLLALLAWRRRRQQSIK